jgi:putative transposase
MPSRRTTKAAQAAAVLPSIPKELIDQFVTGPMSAEAVNAASMAFKKALIERALGAELSHHLGYPPGQDKPEDASNHRNGASGKTVLTEDGPVRIEVPRDREGSFEPVLISKHERRFTGFDDKIVAMYARGMTVREIQGFLAEQYGTEVSPEFISSVTDAVMAEVTAWQSRPLEPMYPVIFFDALRVKIREDAVVRNKAIYLALGVLPEGTRDPGHLDREHRGRQVLAEGLQRSEDARRAGHSDRGYGRTEGHREGAGGGLPRNNAADVHRAPDPQ